MDGMVGERRASGFGRVTIRPIPGPPNDPQDGTGTSAVVDRSLYTWEPDHELAADLPSGFRMAMECLTTSDGTRRFVPAAEAKAFLLEASVGGLAILNRTRCLSDQQRFSYHAMRLIFQHAPRLREHLSRSFSIVADLTIPAVEKGGWDGGDILPARIGLDRDGPGPRWTVAELLEQGRDQALADGESNPDRPRCIAGGLLAAARRDPLDPGSLTEPEARQLVRLALFDLGPAPGDVGEDVKQVMTERLLRAIEKHQDDDAETFDRWFFIERDNVVHQIAKQRKCGGPQPREVVRQVILDLVFDAYTYVGDCVCLQMQAFLRALPTPLDAGERAWFEAVYDKQPYLGGLPLILLRDQFPFLRGAILNLWDDPGDGDRVGVLLRLMQYCGEMVSLRRGVDRAYKRRAHHRDVKGRVGRTHKLEANLTTQSERTPDLRFQEIVNQLRDERVITCSCGAASSWDAKLLGDTVTDPISIEVECPGCEQSLTLEVSRAEFARIGRPILLPEDEEGPQPPGPEPDSEG